MEYSADLLAANQSSARFHDTLKAFVAPVAKATDAVASDPVALRVAQAVCATFGDSGGSNGMTRSELVAACPNTVPAAAFESRLDLFVAMGLLRWFESTTCHILRKRPASCVNAATRAVLLCPALCHLVAM